MGDWRLAVDIGGTFTDVVLLDAAGTTTVIEKVLTTAKDPAAGVMDGTRRALGRAAVSARDVRYVIHGTTLVTNALIERKGATTGLITTAGHEDALEIGRETRYDAYDLAIEKPEPLVPPSLRLGLSARIKADGRESAPVSAAEVDAVVDRLRAAGVEAVAVSLLHGFRNPAHEQAVARRLRERAPGLRVSLSSVVSGEIREYERTSTTVANAYVLGVVETYLRSLSALLRAEGFEGQLLLMLSSGGTCTIETACEVPIRLVESGPAGGAAAAAHHARATGAARVLAFDMGGTTAKICLIDDGEPQITREFEVARVWRFKRGSGLPLLVPVVELIEIGAGGGSIAHVDRMGLPKVGPESAGSEPGPACYGRGGERPTVTDANLVLGYLDAGYFLGGAMPLDRAAAEAAVRRHVGEPLGLSLEEAAWGIHAIVTENMANAALMHAVERGKEIGGYDLYAFGGAAPMHVGTLAERLGIRTVVVPPGRRRAVVLRVPRLAAGLRGRALADGPAGDRRPRRRRRAPRLAGGRRARAAHAGRRGRGRGDREALRRDALSRPGLRARGAAAVGTAQRRLAGRARHRLRERLPDLLPPRAVGAAGGGGDVAGARPVAAAGDAAAAPARGGRAGDRRASAASGSPPSRRSARCPSGTATACRRAGAWPGPAVIEEIESTTVVLPAFDVAVDDGLNLVLTRRQA